ncbi:MAG TPA: DUF2182 domain-containing protein [Candidatus Acidoferrales bacterium]|nr:DUF2182 domain-containing protein [Candidatus Acidoferrales bacterium]
MPAESIAAPSTLVERVIRRDRLIVALAMAAILALAWTYLVSMAAGMHAMAREAQMQAAMAMPEMRGWGAGAFGALFLMWAVMMTGMMLPSAAPMVLLVLGAYRRRGDGRARLGSALFLAGYLLAWTVFSAAAAASQVMLHRAALLSADMAARSTVLAGTILLVAGAYQWLPIKNACLAHCRSPLGFLTRHWREGASGALRMGVEHGLFCIGCCWALMVLLFFAGVMNLLWVAAIALFVLIEKLAPRGPLAGRVAGAALVFWGAYVLIRGG